MMNTMRKKALSLALAFLMAAALCVPVLAAMPEAALADGGVVQTVDVSTFAALENALAGKDINGEDFLPGYTEIEITVTGDISITDILIVETPTTIKGGSLVRGDISGTPYNGILIQVGKTASEPGALTLTNIRIDGENLGDETGVLVNVGSGSLYVGDDVVLTNNKNCGVYVDTPGSFTMTGGEISGNTSAGYGGGVSVQTGGEFTMTGGKISGNTALKDGGGVYTNGTFTMTGGTIGGEEPGDGNTTSEGYGGGVFVDTGGNFVMTGGTIVGNDALLGGGGGVSVNGGEFTMSGDAAISDNKAQYSGGGVYIYNGGEFAMTGGTISGNTVPNGGGGGGGGVCVGINSVFTMDGGAISGNEVQGTKGEGGGVRVIGGGKFMMESGAVTGNRITDTDGKGGGVYVRSDGTLTLGSLADISGNTLAGGAKDNISGAFTQPVKGFLVYDLDDLKAALSYSGDCEEIDIRVMDSFAISEMLTVATPTSITATASDIALTRADAFDGILLQVGKSEAAPSALTLTDITIDGNKRGVSKAGNLVHVQYGALYMGQNAVLANNAGAAVLVNDEGAFTMGGGTISGNVNANENAQGGGVCNLGTFAMKGGAISGNEAGQGGGVYNSGTFTMGGTARISGNSAAFGTGMYQHSGTATLDVIPNDSIGVFVGKAGVYGLGATPGPIRFDGAYKWNDGGTALVPIDVGESFPIATATDAAAWAARFSVVSDAYTFSASGNDIIATRVVSLTTPPTNKNTYGGFSSMPAGDVIDGDTGTADGLPAPGAASAADAPQTARVVASSLNFRSAPSLTSSIQGKLPMNTVVTVLGTTSDGWVHVRLADGREGYVSSRYLVLLTSFRAGQVVTTTANLNLRTGPGTNNPVVRVAQRGSTFTLAGVEGVWAYITENGVRLYMHTAYLR